MPTTMRSAGTRSAAFDAPPSLRLLRRAGPRCPTTLTPQRSSTPVGAESARSSSATGSPTMGESGTSRPLEDGRPGARRLTASVATSWPMNPAPISTTRLGGSRRIEVGVQRERRRRGPAGRGRRLDRLGAGEPAQRGTRGDHDARRHSSTEPSASVTRRVSASSAVARTPRRGVDAQLGELGRVGPARPCRAARPPTSTCLDSGGRS